MKEDKTTRRLKKNYLKTYIPDRTVIYGAYATGYMLFKTFIIYQITRFLLLDITQSDSL